MYVCTPLKVYTVINWIWTSYMCPIHTLCPTGWYLATAWEPSIIEHAINASCVSMQRIGEPALNCTLRSPVLQQ